MSERPSVAIRDASVEDAAAVRAIYNPYVERTTVTFETEPVSVEQMEARIGDATVEHPWLVAEIRGRVAGYAYATSWKSRCSYRLTAESAVYVADEFHRRGVGTALYGTLLDRLRRGPAHAVLAGIALPNPASVALHERSGFVKVAHLREVGRKFDRWIDVGYWQVVFR